MATKHNETGLGSVNLVGFNYSRRWDVRSRSTSDWNWRAQIYTHPERQDKNLEALVQAEAQVALNSRNRSDEYEPAVLLREGGAVVNYRPYHDIYSLGVVLLELGLGIGLGTYKNKSGNPMLQDVTPSKRKECLLGLASGLPVLMGNKYDKVVRDCLNVERDEDATVGKVLAALESIHV